MKSSRTFAAIVGSALVFAATAAVAQTAVPETREQRQGLNPQESNNPANGAGTVNPSGVSGTDAGRTTATGGNPGGAAGRN